MVAIRITKVVPTNHLPMCGFGRTKDQYGNAQAGSRAVRYTEKRDPNDAWEGSSTAGEHRSARQIRTDGTGTVAGNNRKAARRNTCSVSSRGLDTRQGVWRRALRASGSTHRQGSDQKGAQQKKRQDRVPRAGLSFSLHILPCRPSPSRLKLGACAAHYRSQRTH